MKSVKNILILGLVVVGTVITSGCGKKGASILNKAQAMANESCHCKTGAALSACQNGVKAAREAGDKYYLNAIYSRHSKEITVDSFTVLGSEEGLVNKISSECSETSPKNQNDCEDGARYLAQALLELCPSGSCETGRRASPGPGKQLPR